MNTDKELQRHRRYSLVFGLRKDGLSYKEIGAQIGVGPQRARELHAKAERWAAAKGHWTEGLSARLVNILVYQELKSRAEVEAAVRSEKLHPSNRTCRNFGWKSYVEVCRWLGLPEPQKQKAPPRTCPHCGKQI